MGEAKTNQHFVQKAVLKKFSHKSGNQDVITIVDIKQRKIYDRNIKNVFCLPKMYDMENSADVKIIENKLKEEIEDPMSNIINRLEQCCYTEFTITRGELETIKKYILMQLYRNVRDKNHYDDVNIWKKELLYILENSFDKLVCQVSPVGNVQSFAKEIHSSFMMIVRTRGEFCVNEMGYATEQVPCYLSNINIDNYILFPFSTHYAILKVHGLWKQYYMKRMKNEKIIPPSFSPFLPKYLCLPRTIYINRDKMKSESDIYKYRDNNDEYTYQICDISNEDAYYLNTLTLNETLRIIGVHDANELSNSIREFQKRAKYGGAKLNYDFFDEALKQYNKNKKL